MDLAQLIPAVIGLFTPLVVAFAKQPKFAGTKINLIIALIVCFVVGGATAFLNGQLAGVALTAPSIFNAIAIVTAAAFAAYQAYWKDSELEQKLAAVAVAGPKQTDNGVRPEDGPQDVSQDPNIAYEDESVEVSE